MLKPPPLKVTQLKRRNFLLLEVLISLLLVVLCAAPFFSSQVFMYKQEAQFQTKLELERIVNLLFVNVMQNLYENKISWQQIIEQQEQSFGNDAEAFFPKHLPCTATYTFKDGRVKPAEDKLVARHYYRKKLIIAVTPKKTDLPKMSYTYEVMLVKEHPGTTLEAQLEELEDEKELDAEPT